MHSIAPNPNAAKYPIFITPNGETCVTGVKIVGQQHRQLPYRLLKQAYDGDGVHMEGPGKQVLENAWIDNVEDAFAPRGPKASTSWVVRGVYARYNRDDFVENDALLDGEIDNVLVDGTYVFLSARPGKNARSWDDSMRVTIKNTLAHLQNLPYDTDMGGRRAYHPEDDSAHAQVFKWASPSGGNVIVIDSIFLIDGGHEPPPQSLGFAPGIYKNVIIVWAGKGRYPGTLPAGIMLTTDRSVWDKARVDWLQRHGCDANGDDCAFLHASN